MQVQGFNLGSKVTDDAQIQLGIYRGMNDDHRAQFDYVTLPTQGDNGPYQGVHHRRRPWELDGRLSRSEPRLHPDQRFADAVHRRRDDVYWYQLVIADSQGDNRRVFDIYATSAGPTPGQLQPYNPAANIGSATTPLAAIDNNAGVLVNIATQINVNLQPDASSALSAADQRL